MNKLNTLESNPKIIRHKQYGYFERDVTPVDITSITNYINVELVGFTNSEKMVAILNGQTNESTDTPSVATLYNITVDNLQIASDWSNYNQVSYQVIEFY